MGDPAEILTGPQQVIKSDISCDDVFNLKKLPRMGERGWMPDSCMPQVIQRFSNLAQAEITTSMSEQQISDIEKCKAVWDDIQQDGKCNVSWADQSNKKLDGVWYFAFNLDNPNLRYVGKTGIFISM